jgi:hypothetical protein
MYGAKSAFIFSANCVPKSALASSGKEQVRHGKTSRAEAQVDPDEDW